MRRTSLYGSLLLAFLLSLPHLLWAQQQPAMDNVMVKDGKIYVVVAVLTVIFIGIILFLISMERKLNKIERSEKSP